MILYVYTCIYVCVALAFHCRGGDLRDHAQQPLAEKLDEVPAIWLSIWASASDIVPLEFALMFSFFGKGNREKTLGVLLLCRSQVQRNGLCLSPHMTVSSNHLQNRDGIYIIQAVTQDM